MDIFRPCALMPLTVALLKFFVLLSGRVDAEFTKPSDDFIEMPCGGYDDDEPLTRSESLEKWPGAIVPYETEDNYREQDHEALKTAIEDYHNHTCIRFIPRTQDHTAYVTVIVNSTLSGVCGHAAFCYKGNHQTATIAASCSIPRVFVHELGHALCLGHEHTRVDRDDYLDLSECKNPAEIQGIHDVDTQRGNLYDYHSQMTYPCYSCVGKPKLKDVLKCKNDYGLSVLDADKLNNIYNCQGCFRHRWYRVDTLTKEQEAELINFAGLEGEGPIYMCRGYFLGSVSPGMYNPLEKTCLVGARERLQNISMDIQVFAIPGGPATITNETPATAGYSLYNPTDSKEVHMRAGRNEGDVTLFAAVYMFVGSDGQKKTVLGYTEGGIHGFFPQDNEQKIIKYSVEENQIFKVVGCI